MGFHCTRPAVGAKGKRKADALAGKAPRTRTGAPPCGEVAALAGKGFDGCGSERRSAMFQCLRSETPPVALPRVLPRSAPAVG